jgi:hypothetical protein
MQPKNCFKCGRLYRFDLLEKCPACSLRTKFQSAEYEIFEKSSTQSPVDDVIKSQIPEFSKEVIVTSIGVGIIQAMDFYINEIEIGEDETRALWSPFLAATTRMVKPPDEMVSIFLRSPKTTKVQKALSDEFLSPNPMFYAPFNESLSHFLKTIATAIGENCYLPVVLQQGSLIKQDTATEVMEMLNFFIDDQNSKGRKVQTTDNAFKTILCLALPMHIEDIMRGNSLHGVKNTGQMIQAGQVVFATALLLQIISGMVE